MRGLPAPWSNTEHGRHGIGCRAKSTTKAVLGEASLRDIALDNFISAASSAGSLDESTVEGDIDRFFLSNEDGVKAFTGDKGELEEKEKTVKDVDPFAVVSRDMKRLNESIKTMLGSDHPVLSTVAQYFFDVEGGKKVRPTMVLLTAQACAAHNNKINNNAQAEAQASAKQVRLAEITEMIHTASLLHDDVIDMADTRRGVGSVNKMFGNKLAVLAGDFLLARASVSLARLRQVDVIEVLSTVIEHLVKGEVMQIRQKSSSSFQDSNSAFEFYLRKNFYKTGSLMANSCRAAAMLGGSDQSTTLAAYEFGRGVGAAFQLVDDVLDFDASEEQIGKPIMNVLRTGLCHRTRLFCTRVIPADRESHRQEIFCARRCRRGVQLRPKEQFH